MGQDAQAGAGEGGGAADSAGGHATHAWGCFICINVTAGGRMEGDATARGTDITSGGDADAGAKITPTF